ncbi:aminotransferase class I/II-fold pyridoxal phosphate-dependent enzyme [Paenibacillus sp. UNC499MF]|uniref:aminotransferase class I/II-fold pyridoxal phosphate-dependent enzyme n=1 Tax=Paenibacillus sp. UNC499MF TaxID=1502751 RepID=UPI00215654AA|nr:aminotransferase class I/II-fold pyridoxal phosphate-dependent enzyme [Paenibacillus sp. UNC499MF]
MKILIPFNHYAQLFPHKNTALYHALRESIVEGRLESGSKLPSSRELAEVYGISRGLVTQVYEMLISEGYVEGRPGKGTFVAYRSDQGAGTGSLSEEPLLLSAWGDFLMQPGGGGGRRKEESGDGAGKKDDSPRREYGGAERRPGGADPDSGADAGAAGHEHNGGVEQARPGAARREYNGGMEREGSGAARREHNGGVERAGARAAGREHNDGMEQAGARAGGREHNGGVEQAGEAAAGREHNGGVDQARAGAARREYNDGVEQAGSGAAGREHNGGVEQAGARAAGRGHNGGVERAGAGSAQASGVQPAAHSGTRGRADQTHNRTRSAEPHIPAVPDAVVFELSGTDSAVFPRQAWNRCLHEQVRSAAFLEGPLRDPQGDYSLRSAIALHLRRSRSIDADPDCVAIVNGSMQAIALTMQLLVGPGDEVVVESPGYSGAVRAASAAGGKAVDAPVDAQGIIPQPWNARLLFVTPGRQFPTGAVLPLQRRQELLRWAKERGAVIIEDDYDTEFRYAGRPLEPLKALDREGRVLFVGTFSRTMYAGLRLGYAVLPPSLVEPFRRAKQHYEPLTTGMLEQRALASFMNSGAYERHLRKMQRVYGEKAALLRSGLTALDSAFEWMPSEAGLHIFGWWKGGAEEYRRFASACAGRGVFWRDAGRHVRCGERPAACFGFGHLSREEIGRGIAVMGEVLTETFL